MFLRNAEVDPQAAVFRELRIKGPAVLFSDGRGNCETDTEAAALVLAAGGVHPVK